MTLTYNGDVESKDIEMINIVDETTSHTAYGSEFFTNRWREAELFLKCTSLTGTSPTLDVIVQAYDPNIADWNDIATFTQLSAAGSERKIVTAGLGWKERVKYTTGGTVTDCDFKVGAVFKR